MEVAGTAPRTTSRIAETLARYRAQGRTAIVPYLTVGYPDLDTVQRVAPALVEGGAAMIELGIPFSDPLADGATIQQASHRALQNGVTVARCFETARELRHEGVDVPLIFMGYFNPILRFGVERFAARCAEVGVDGLIVPDLPPDESDEVLEACRRYGRDLIFMVAPTSTDDLIAAVTRRASGFIYCVSLTGVTGARESLSAGLGDFIRRVRRRTDLPLAIGFGISRP
ncbi:MAG: tryptophan synthase subunit alpha, partial [Thermomicrobiaceae bacterium]|nr:tryptophan synthase subunit alpha [Thermomicrobiaceae bacterium]